jgi:hypothetical protein
MAKSNKFQNNAELSFVFDPLSWFLVPGSWFFVLPSIPVFLNQL